MSLSEIMTIVIYFHLSNQRTFKRYYLKFVCTVLKPYFPKLVSYNRFVEIMKLSIVPLLLYLMKYRTGKCTGISFINSTALDACDSHRIHSHKVFEGPAKRGKSSAGWFYGFKLHLVINDMGEILCAYLTSGNADDRDWETISYLTKELYGKLFADKGYLSQKLFEKLFKRNITLLLRKRAVIESVNDFLKNICQIEHSRHRSVDNFIVNLLSALVAYSFFPKKPSLHMRKELVSL